MLVSAVNVAKEYGPLTVLSEASFSIEPGDRIGLVGRNGAGKSTLLRLLTGEIVPDHGSIRRASNVRVRSLMQDPVFLTGATVDEILEAAFHDLDALETELNAAALAMSSGTPESILHHEEVLQQYMRRGGFERRSRKEAVTLAFGFRGRETDLVAGLSGGERTRLGLAALLVENPDVLLLDEPTNHLDIVMVQWLESFLLRYPGAVLVISHDRAFLDNVTNETVYLREGTLKKYPGAYTAFREILSAELDQQAVRYAQDAKAIASLQASADRMKVWGLGMSKLARRAKAMQTRVDRMRASATSAPPPEERTTRMTFYAPESGDVVLDARHMTKKVGDRTLFQNVSVQLRRGDRVAIIGRNGAGKTMLLRTLLGLTPSDDPKGRILTGARVNVGYYDQALRGVDPNQTLYDIALQYVQTDKAAHNLLGTFMFPFDQHDKPAHILSGGEKAHLALLKLAQEDHNFLVLDEPTNHLDIEMVEALESALSSYNGALLIVSHDRAFIEGLVDRIWLIENGEFYEYLGWLDYKEKHRQIEIMAPVTGDKKIKEPIRRASIKVKSLWNLKQEIEILENDIAQLEIALLEAQTVLSQAKLDADFAKLGQKVHDLESKLEEKIQAWSQVQADLDAREG